MGLASLLSRGQMTADPNALLTPWGDWGPQATAALPAVNHTTALQLLTVYGCNRFICDGISTLPVDVLRRRADGSPEELSTPSIISQPSPDLDFTAWASQVLTSLLLAGNFYGYREYQNGRLISVLPLDPEKVKVVRERGRKQFVIEGVYYSTFEILHIPAAMWPGSDIGMSPLEAARLTIGAGTSVQEFAGRYFGQDGTMPGVIEVPGDLEPAQTREMASSWARARRKSGEQGTKLPGVLVGGATWKPVGVTNEQSQFLETQGFNQSQIAAQMFHIDPAEMGLPVQGSSLTYTNQEQRNIRKVQVTFLPWIKRLETALTSFLPRPQYVKLNVNGLLRGDTTARFQAYATGIQNQFMVPNEARAFEDWQPLEGGDATVQTTPPQEGEQP